jgi:putative inorganic carbon (HCO3(-)) transporter
VLSFVPAKWTQRMTTIEAYQADRSAEGRLNAWILAWRLALARPLLGWGPQAMEDKTLYDRYYPDSPTNNDVHSSYFQLLAENGFIAFAVFVFLLGWSLIKLQRLGTSHRGGGENQWVAMYADMFQVAICGYAVSAAFLEMAFFDYIYYIIGATIVLSSLADNLVEPVASQRPIGARRPALATA